MFVNRTISLAFTFLLFGCATTPREKIIQNILIGAAAGVVLGQVQPSHKEAYSLIYAGLGGAGAGLVTTYYSNIDDLQKRTQDENQRLKIQIDDLLKPKVAAQAPGTFSSKIPEKYRSLVNPGEWKVFEIDQWIEESENRLIHQDRIMELIPPTLNPNRSGEKSEK